MPIQGLRTSENFDPTTVRPENWREAMLLLFPNGMLPLTALTSQMKSRSVDDPYFHWFEKKMQDRRLILGASITAADTTLTITDNTAASGQSTALSVKSGDVVMSEQTGELMAVVSDPTAATAIEVVRAFAGSTAAALDPAAAGINPHLIVVGSAYEEGSNAPTGVNFDPVEKSNRTQIFRTTLEMTRTAQKTRLRTGDQVREAKRECLEIHGVDMERAFWFGMASLTTLNNKPRHTMDGVLQFIPDDGTVDPIPRTFNAPAGGVDMEWVEEAFYQIFQYGSSEKMGFLGNRALLTLGQVLRKNASWEFTSGVKEFGMRVTRVFSPFGEVVFKTHPLFNQMRGGQTAGTDYNGWEANCVILDMGNLTHVTLAGDDTVWEPDLQENDLDGMKAGYLSEVSIEIHHPLTHARLNGLVTAIADT